MADPAADPISFLRFQARRSVDRAHVPYSGRRVAAVLLLSDGTWVPGVRVESASFSLVIPAVLNAWTTAVAAGRCDVVALVQSEPLSAGDRAFLATWPGPPLAPCGEDACQGADDAPLPPPGLLLDPFLPDALFPADGLEQARVVAQRALIPESDFPVGCVLVTDEGTALPGVNVEHPDWRHILCAERSALGTAVTWGVAARLKALYLTCPRDANASPCGACRQLLTELAPGLSLWIDRGGAPPETTTPEQLLPGSFSGRVLLRNP
jgi:homotetrameric cytidine deaminase